MRQDWLALLEKPPLYQKTSVPFWDDTHISKGMLQAHLDPLFEGASRRLDFVDRSADWIGGLLPPENYGALLDLGCGPGLYAERFARRGYRVTGVDVSKRSLAHAEASARDQGLNIRYSLQDYLRLRLDGRFDLATMIYCDYGALSTQDRLLLLRTVRGLLRPGGRLLFDVFSMRRYEAFEEGQSWEHCPHGGFWRPDAHLALHRNVRYPDWVSLEQTVVLPQEGEAAVYYIWNTYFSRESLRQETASAGFRTVEIFGDVAGAAYAQSSPILAILLEA